MKDAKAGFAKSVPEIVKGASLGKKMKVDGQSYELGHGDVVIAAITSCTNTSNPSVLIAAGLVARNAHAKGLKVKPWVKTSFAPGSQVVTDYLDKAGLTPSSTRWASTSPAMAARSASAIPGRCRTTCRRRSTTAIWSPPPCSRATATSKAASTPRSRPTIWPRRRWSSPMRIAGTMNLDLTTEPLGKGSDGKDVYLKDIWPSSAEIAETVRTCVTPDTFAKRYSDVFKGDEKWQGMGKARASLTYGWNSVSTYVANPPYFDGITMEPKPVTDIVNARILGMFGDSITTDHISPAGAIKKDGPAGNYLIERQVRPNDFNSFGARRGNHEVMMRGTFANIRIKNLMLGGKEGGNTFHVPTGKETSIFEAAMQYKDEGTPLVIFAGKEYGTGSSRDWAAKGTALLGVRAVVCPVVRAYPPLEPRRHGRVAAGVQGWPERCGPRAQGRRGGQHRRTRDIEAAPGRDAGHHLCGRHREKGARALPHRYRGRDELLPPRRHSSLRAAQSCGRCLTIAVQQSQKPAW